MSRAHSPTNQSVLVSPLLSPPAQFSSPKSKADQMKLAGSASTMGYVTLPRKLNSSNRYCCIFFFLVTMLVQVVEFDEMASEIQ